MPPRKDDPGFKSSIKRSTVAQRETNRWVKDLGKQPAEHRNKAKQKRKTKKG